MVESLRASRTSPITDHLAGKTILVTGATGFLGIALMERLLTDVPTCRLVLLVRSRFGSSPQSRIREVLGRAAFDRFRERNGPDAVDRALEERIEIVEGDVSDESLPPFPAGIEVVVHCAASVSFDSPIDQAFQTNVLGMLRLYEAVVASRNTPHVVHVSTAYVAGSMKGVVREAALEHSVDWRREADWALTARAAVEAASRKPEMLDRFIARATKEHRRAGPSVVAKAAEDAREDWVSKRLIQYGRARAQSLGWPDVYTFTKALGERAVEQLASREGLPLSIVRPSIIESALERPHPGWIEGFKMAEPIILAYGRGAIPEFPGIPDGVMDIIPVDLVVNAMLAVAATRPEDGPAYIQGSPGRPNRLPSRC